MLSRKCFFLVLVGMAFMVYYFICFEENVLKYMKCTFSDEEEKNENIASSIPATIFLLSGFLLLMYSAKRIGYV